jgi:hypothetical protein
VRVIQMIDCIIYVVWGTIGQPGGMQANCTGAQLEGNLL